MWEMKHEGPFCNNVDEFVWTHHIDCWQEVWIYEKIR